MTQKSRPSYLLLGASSLVLLITGGILYAGPLDPPAGPIVSTGKTLVEVEPRIAINLTNTPGDADSLFKISQPGSYCLTGNITGVAGKHIIEIAASGVTLDLNGFDLVGVPRMGFFDGVRATVANLTEIAVLNGSVRSCGGSGVDLGSFNALNSRIENVRAGNNLGAGVVAGKGGTVTKCSAWSNTGFGINVGEATTIVECSAYQNTTGGISTGSGCTISNCAAASNTGIGIRVGSAGVVVNCSASLNTTTGIDTENGVTISNCSVYQNTGNGIIADSGNTISNCTAYENRSNGILAGNIGCTIENCTVRLNSGDGIVAFAQNLIRNNICSNNSNSGNGAGIHTTGTDNRIEGNNCTGARRGIEVGGQGNIVVRNTCSGNTTDWVIEANNIVGPIVDRRAPASGAISGFSAPSTLGSSDPNANFSY